MALVIRNRRLTIYLKQICVVTTGILSEKNSENLVHVFGKDKDHMLEDINGFL